MANRFILGNKIGEGAFGTVYKAMDRQQGEEVAIKVLKMNGLTWGAKRIQSSVREVNILANLEHDNILRIICGCTFKDENKLLSEIWIVTELCTHGSLLEILERCVRHNNCIPTNERLNVYMQLMSALTYMHKKGYAHRDIKLDNILVDKNDRVKLADMGLAKVLVPNDTLSDISQLYLTTLCGTRPYMAPEVFLGHYDLPCDIFSMGLVMYVICELPASLTPKVHTSSTSPYLGEAMKDKLKNGSHADPLELLAPQNVITDWERDILNHMLQAEPNNRLNASQVYRKLQPWCNIL